MERPRIAVMASGAGTTAEAFIRANQAGETEAAVALVICNNAKAKVFDRIKTLNQEFELDIQTQLISGATHPAQTGEIVAPGAQTKAEELAILALLKAGGFDLIILMGYMKRIGSELVRGFGWRSEYTSPYQAMMLNTHPGLLPETKGLYGRGVQEYTLAKSLPFGGQTLHVVSEDYDDGPIVAEHKVAVEPDDTAEALFARVQAIEKQMLPIDVAAFIKNRQTYLKEEA